MPASRCARRCLSRAGTSTRAYLERYGKPVAFYSDKHAIFRVNSKEAQGGDGMTQFGRALDELTIEIICDDLGGRVRGPGRWTQAGGGAATGPAGGPGGAGDRPSAAIPRPLCAGSAEANASSLARWPSAASGGQKLVGRLLRGSASACRPTARPARGQPSRPRRPIRIHQRAVQAGDRRPAGDLGRYQEEGAGRRLQERRPRAAPQGPARSGAGARFRDPRAGQGRALRRLRPAANPAGSTSASTTTRPPSRSRASAAGGATWAGRATPRPHGC